MSIKEKIEKLIAGDKKTKTTVLTELDKALINAKTAEETKRLIAAGADVNAKDEYGDTALICCSRHMFNTAFALAVGLRKTPEEAYREKEEAYPETVEQMKLLIAAGANVNAKDKFGDTALDYVLFERKTDIEKMKLLIAAGANVNEGKYSPLMRAQTTEQTKILIAAGANVNAKDRYGKTPLMHAHTPEQVKLLIAAGADVNARDKEGCSILHFCYGPHGEEIETLIKEAMAKVQPSMTNIIKMKLKKFVKGR